MNTKISVCIPNYNYGRYLPQAIESVLAQDYDGFELLIADDSSSDDSVEVIRAYAARDSRIRLLINERNIGMVANWNLCLREARGEYVKFLFADDYFTAPTVLRLMAESLDRFPTVTLVGSARRFVDEAGAVRRVVSHFSGSGLCRGVGAMGRALLEERNLFGEPSAVMFRRNSAARGFDLSYRQLVDLEMWLHLLGQGDYFHFATPLVAFREHDSQQTVVNMNTGGLLSAELLSLNTGYARRNDLFGGFWRWYLACQQVSRRRRWGHESGRLHLSASIEILACKLLKPFLKGWCRSRGTKLNNITLNES